MEIKFRAPHAIDAACAAQPSHWLISTQKTRAGAWGATKPDFAGSRQAASVVGRSASSPRGSGATSF